MIKDEDRDVISPEEKIKHLEAELAKAKSDLAERNVIASTVDKSVINNGDYNKIYANIDDSAETLLQQYYL